MEEHAITNFRYKFERTQENPLGINTRAIDRLIEVISKYEESDNEYVRMIAQNIDKLDSFAPNYTIFESSKTGFRYPFCALQINPNSDEIIISHELAHSLFTAVNKTHIPENFKDTFYRARENNTSPENKEAFKDYIEYICESGKDKITEAERGPVSDILSSIRLNPHITIATKNNKTFTLPNCHERAYYFDEEKQEPKWKYIYDENFANFFALTALNCTNELEILRVFLGEEWFQTMQEELVSIAVKLKEFGEIDPEKVM